MTTSPWTVKVLRGDDFVEVAVSEANATTFASRVEPTRLVRAVCMNEPFVVWVGDSMDSGLAGDYLMFRKGKPPFPVDRDSFDNNYVQEPA